MYEPTEHHHPEGDEPEIPEFVKRAIEAQGKTSPDEVQAVLAAGLAETEPIYEEEAITMALDEPRPIKWEEFFTASEVAATKRVRRGQSALGPLTRTWIAERVGGTIGDGARSAKEFLNTRRGKFAISLSADNLNSTELAAIERMGAVHVAVENVADICEFFTDHGLPGWETYEQLREHLHERMRQV